MFRLYRRARTLPGIKKVLIGSGVRYDLAVQSPEYVKELVTQALMPFTMAKPGSLGKLVEYFFDRLTGYLRDLGYSALEVDAVVSVRPPWGEMPVRLAAVRAFQKTARSGKPCCSEQANRQYPEEIRRGDKRYRQIPAG